MDEPTYTFKQPSEPVVDFMNMKPNSNLSFHNGGKQVGVLDFNGPEMMFSGDADESAKVFFDFIAKSFKARLEQERADEREACVRKTEEFARKWWKIHCDSNLHYSSTLKAHQDFCALQAAIKARKNT